MNPNDILINVQVNGINQLTALSNAMRQMNATLAKTSTSMSSLDARARALSQAMGRNERGEREHAKTLSQLITHQSALGNEMRRVRTDYQNVQKNVLQNSTAIRGLVGNLKQYEKSLKGIKSRALVEDLRSLSIEMKRLGKDAQFTGRSMIIGITTPILAFARTGLYTFLDLDKEMVRLNKLIDNMAPSLEVAAQKLGVEVENINKEVIKAQKILQTTTLETLDKLNDDPLTRTTASLMAAKYLEFRRVDEGILSISQNFGVARPLVAAVAGDFAELGLNANESIISLTRLSAEAEKLGNLDIGPSKDMILSIYSQATTMIQQNALARGKLVSALEAEKKAVKVAAGQLYIFNAIENSTALSLADLAQAFPEVAAATTQFGLSMSEAAAFMAPMKAAGFEVGASANSIKVSLQRLNDPTVKASERLMALSEATGYDFQAASSIGITAIDALAKGFDVLMRKTELGKEGTQELFNTLFESRQGPRMQVLIESLSLFNNELQDTGQRAGKIAQEINKFNETTARGMLPTVRTFSDLSAIARISAGEIGDTVDYINEFGEKATTVITGQTKRLAGQIRTQIGKQIEEERKYGKDLINEITSQAGRALMVQFAGPKSAEDRAKAELDTALSSVSVLMDRMKNNFKLIASELVKSLKPALEAIANFVEKITVKFQNLSPGFKQLIVVTAGLLAALGPLVFAFGQARLAIATLGNALLKFVPGLSFLTAESIASSTALLNLRKPLVLVNGLVETSASKFSILVARMASMPGPVGTMASAFGRLTGILRSNVTASKEVIHNVNLMKTTMASGYGEGRAAKELTRGLDPFTPGVYGATAGSYVTTADAQTKIAKGFSSIQIKNLGKNLPDIKDQESIYKDILEIKARTLGYDIKDLELNSAGKLYDTKSGKIVMGRKRLASIENFARVEYLGQLRKRNALIKAEYIEKMTGVKYTRESPMVPSAFDKYKGSILKTAKPGTSFGKTIGKSGKEISTKFGLDRAIANRMIIGQARGLDYATGVATFKGRQLSRRLEDMAISGGVFEKIAKSYLPFQKIGARIGKIIAGSGQIIFGSLLSVGKAVVMMTARAALLMGSGLREMASTVTNIAAQSASFIFYGIVGIGKSALHALAVIPKLFIAGTKGAISGISKAFTSLASGVGSSINKVSLFMQRKFIGLTSAIGALPSTLNNKFRDMISNMMYNAAVSASSASKVVSDTAVSYVGQLRKAGAAVVSGFNSFHDKLFVTSSKAFNAFHDRLFKFRTNAMTGIKNAFISGYSSAMSGLSSAMSKTRSVISTGLSNIGTELTNKFGLMKTSVINGGKVVVENFWNFVTSMKIQFAAARADFANGMDGIVKAFSKGFARMRGASAMSATGSGGIFKSIKEFGRGLRRKNLISSDLIVDDDFEGDLLPGQMRRKDVPADKIVAGRARRGVARVLATPARMTGIPQIKEAAKARTAVMGALEGAGVQSGFIKQTKGIFAFIKALKSSLSVVKLLRVAMLGFAGIVVFTAILATIAIIFNLLKKGGDQMNKTKHNFKVAWQVIHATINAVIKPIRDAIYTIVNMFTGGGGGGGLEKFSEKIRKIANQIKDFVTKNVVPVIEVVMTAVVDVIHGVARIIKGIIQIFQGDWKKGLITILKGFGNIFRAIIKIIATVIKIQISIWNVGIKIVISIIAGLAKAIVSLIGGAIKKVADLIGLLGKIPGLEAIGDAMGWVKDKIDGVTDSVNGFIDDSANFAKGVADGAADLAKSGVDNLTDFVTGFIDGLIGKSQKLMDSTGKNLLPDGAAEEEGENWAEEFVDSAGEGLEAGGEDLADALSNVMNELGQKFVDLVIDNVAEAMQKAVGEMTKALEAQKEAALGAFDAQLEALEQLEKAEQSLTKEMQYQADRRKMIQERELQMANYQRNRALAIYEGRIDDARVLSLEEQKNSTEFNDNLIKLDEDRRRDLASENLDAMKNAIKKAKDETDKFFDDQIKKFAEAAAEITKFPPLTIEEYQDQIDALANVATELSNESQGALSVALQGMVDTIQNYIPNEGVAAFGTEISKLVDVAKEKYGFLPNDINAITIAMLQKTGATIGNDEYIRTQFGTILDDINTDAELAFNDIAYNVIEPSLQDIGKVINDNNPMQKFAKAIREANKQIIFDMEKMLNTVASKVRWLLPFLDKRAITMAMLDYLAGRQSGGGGDNDPSGGGAMSLVLSKNVALTKQYGGRIPSFEYGGMMKSFAIGGFNRGYVVPGMTSTPVPALLHGGEYVVNAKAVNNIGYATLEALNNMRFSQPKSMASAAPSYASGQSMSTTNIYVENFIGEDEWFNSMLKQYNMNVLPKNQKSAGLESRVIGSYSGLARGR